MKPLALRPLERDGSITAIVDRDEERYFFFTGRMKEIVRRKGENISALEVEAAINRHPKVLESAVIGVSSPSGLGDEEVKAYVVSKFLDIWITGRIFQRIRWEG